MVEQGVECAIRSDDLRVSRSHARLFVDRGALWVEDHGSSNGIYVGPNSIYVGPNKGRRQRCRPARSC
jgi:hypothetical protein